MIVVMLGAVVGGIAFVMLWKELAAKNRPRKLSSFAVAAAMVLVAVLVLLTATGRLHWLAASAAAVLPLLRWVLGMIAGPLIGNFFRARAFRRAAPAPDADAGPGAGPTASTVATGDLRMTLDLQTGDMDGDVLTGRFAGQRLSNLDLAALSALHDELSATDSRQLLSAYLDRRFPGWADAEEQPRGAPPDASEMDEEQALAVLGLDAGASKEEVVAAHRRLMQRLHPDRGGTDYLAATLNLAKKALLDRV